MPLTTSRITYSNNRDHNGSFLLYINKIEVPGASVRVKYGVWGIPEATINMAPDPVLQRLGAEDRVQVQVFFIDDFLLDSSGQEATPRLLMEGEIVGWGYQNTKAGRSITFSVVNQMAIFTQLFVQFLTNVDDMAAHAVDIGTITTSAPTRSELVLPYSYFTQGLVGTDRIRRPFDFLYNCVKNFLVPSIPDSPGEPPPGGFNAMPAAQRAVPAANFFARWARLTNFHNRFVATPTFDEGDGADNIFPILKALQTTSAIDVLSKSLIGQVQNAGSLWDMLQTVFQTMFEEIAMIPTAPLVSVDLKTSQVLPTKFTDHKVVDDGNKTKAATDPIPTKPNRLVNYFTKPQFIFGLPPTCNVIFPSMVEQYSYDENFATQATRLYFNDEVINRLFNVRGQLDPAILNALAVAYPPEASGFQVAKQSNLKSTGKNFLLFPEEFFKGPVMDRRALPTWLYFLKQAEETKKGQQDQKTSPDDTPAGTSPFSLIKDTDPNVYFLYAEYEYFRERFSRRAGAVVCKFNPFVIPGFPGAVFDNRATRMDIFCYITSVEHVMAERSVQTVISYAYGRTFQEMFDLLAKDFAEGSTAFAVGPRDPIRDVRDVIQHFASAETFYQALLFGRPEKPLKAAAFDWRQVVGYRSDIEGDQPDPIILDGTNDSLINAYNQAVLDDRKLAANLTVLAESQAAAEAEVIAATEDIDRISSLTVTTPVDVAQLNQAEATLAASTTKRADLDKRVAENEAERAKLLPTLQNKDVQNKTVTHNLSTTRELVPMPSFEDAFNSFDAAMQYVWRPICSLDEYIIFTGVVGENPIPAFGTPFSIGARYYERIGRMVPLPANFKLPPGADGIAGVITQLSSTTQVAQPDGGNQGAPQPAPTVPGLQPDFPQTRANWDLALLAYRSNVYIAKVPRG